MEGEQNEVPFDMAKETLKSIRLWIDRITQVSVGFFGGNRIDPNEMIIVKHKMVQQLIVLATPLLDNDLEEIEEFYSDIEMKRGTIKNQTGIYRDVIIYSESVNKELDECVQGIQKSLKKYFVPTIKNGELY